MEQPSTPHKYLDIFQTGRLALRDLTETGALSIGVCPFSFDAMIELYDQSGLEVCLEGRTPLLDQMSATLRDHAHFGTDGETLMVTDTYAVIGKEIDGEPHDTGVIVDISRCPQHTTFDFRFDALGRQIMGNLSQILKQDNAPMISLGYLAIFKGENIEMEQVRAIDATNLDDDDVSAFIEDMDLAAASIVVDVHRAAKGDLHTATVSMIDECPDTGRRFRSVFASRIFTGSANLLHASPCGDLN